MKKTLIYLLLLFMYSCGQPISKEEKEKLKNEIQELNKSQSLATDLLNHTNYQMSTGQNELVKLKEQIERKKLELNILNTGNLPRYILKLRFQEHKFELSVDRIEFEFEIPVDEKFYNESKVGKKLGSGSRLASFHSGDITVVKKRVELWN